MKTRYFILTTLAMAGLAVSCAKSQIGGETPLPEEEAPVPIQLTTNLKVNSVSVTKAGVDTWAGQKLYIYALPTNEIPEEDSDKILVNNAEASAPQNGAAETAHSIDLYDTTSGGNGIFYYYPADKTTLDFYGYYVDDAFMDPAQEDDEQAKPEPNIATNDKIWLPLYLNGSQDIMLAKADKDADVLAPGVRELISPANAYSAYSARKNVVPNLKFEHQLSRFVFRLIAGNPKGQNVRINSISLTSKAEADLVIAGTSTGLTNCRTDANFSLKPVDNETGPAITAFRPTYTPLSDDQVDLTIDDNDKIGESIMVIPDVEHIMKISMTQLDDQGTTGVKNFVYEYHLTPSMVKDTTPDEIEPFRAGYKYNVDVVIYGLQQVLVNVTLTAWNEGGSITIDNDTEWGDEPKLGYKATGPDSKEYYLYFYGVSNVITPGMEVKYWKKDTNEMAAPESGNYLFDANRGTPESPIWGVTLTKDDAANKTTVTTLIETDPNIPATE